MSMMRPALPSSLGLFAACFAAVTLAPASALADDAACIAASEQSLTLRQSGHLHEALKQLAECAATACPDEVKVECARRIEAIGAVMPTLVLGATDGSGNDLSAVEVTMDGAPLVAALDGRPIAVDPGAHSFRFAMAGQPPVEKTLVVREGEKDRRETVVLGPPPAMPAVAPAAPSSSSAPALAPLAPRPPWSTQHVLAVAAGSAGVVGLAVGTVFAVYASSAQHDEKSNCPAAGCTRFAQSAEDYDTAKKDATGATIAYVAGGVLVASAIVLWVTAPHAATAAPSARRIDVAPAFFGPSRGLVLRGEF
jgi:hypothetical protein